MGYWKRLSKKMGIAGSLTISKAADLQSGFFISVDSPVKEPFQHVEDVGFEWNPHETDFEAGIRGLESYKQRCGDCRVPLDHQENGFPLGEWSHTQRARKKSMPDKRRQRLDALGFVWDLYETDWERGLNYLRVFKNRVGNCRVPTNHRENGFNLGRWVINQRRLKDQIPPERRQRLDELGFIWDVRGADWEEGYSYLKLYKERVGHCSVPQKHVENGFRLGIWVTVQRRERNSMTEYRRQKLEELGFVWDTLSEQWEEAFRHLKSYKERCGHCRVPVDYKQDGFPLGTWVRVQRRNKDKMPIERRRRLDELGFSWEAPHKTSWEKGLRLMKAYKLRKGHCRVPRDHNENGFPLGQWASNQRSKGDKMLMERRQQLDELGFVWTNK